MWVSLLLTRNSVHYSFPRFWYLVYWMCIEYKDCVYNCWEINVWRLLLKLKILYIYTIGFIRRENIMMLGYLSFLVLRGWMDVLQITSQRNCHLWNTASHLIQDLGYHIVFLSPDSKKYRFLHGGVVASWLEPSSPARAVRVRALARTFYCIAFQMILERKWCHWTRNDPRCGPQMIPISIFNLQI